MAIRDVSGTKTAQPAPAGGGGVPPALEKALQNAGLLAPGQDPKQVIQQLLGGLKAQGFSAAVKAPLPDQLRQALVALQRANGLPVNGNLDAATTALLQNLGVVKKPGEEGKQAAAQKDGFERAAPSLLKANDGARKTRAEEAQQKAPNADFVDGLLNLLGGGGQALGEASKDLGGKAVFGVGHGVEVQAQGQAQVQAAKAAGESKETAGNIKREAEAPLQPHGMEAGNQKGVKVARGLQAKETHTDERARTDAPAGAEDPSGAGVDEGEEGALEGAGEDGKRRRGKGGAHDGAADEGEDAAAAGRQKEDGGTERDAGNASSGDRDEDERRGHASLDDGSEDEAGYYEVPPLSKQAWTSLSLIKKDESEENRATTYSWDATFYRPDVYGPGQKAQDVLHLVVDRATAFDAAWRKAVENLAILVRRFEPEADVPTLDDVVAALRQARARDGDRTAGDLSKQKLIRPMKA